MVIGVGGRRHGYHRWSAAQLDETLGHAKVPFQLEKSASLKGLPQGAECGLPIRVIGQGRDYTLVGWTVFDVDKLAEGLKRLVGHRFDFKFVGLNHRFS